MSSDMPVWHSSLSKVLLQLACNRHVYQSSTLRCFIWCYLPGCSATTGCTVMRIVIKLGSFAYHIFFFLSANFRDCIFFPSWGVNFNVPECNWNEIESDIGLEFHYSIIINEKCVRGIHTYTRTHTYIHINMYLQGWTKEKMQNYWRLWINIWISEKFYFIIYWFKYF